MAWSGSRQPAAIPTDREKSAVHRGRGLRHEPEFVVPGPEDQERWSGRTLDTALWQSCALGMVPWFLLVGALVAWYDPGSRPVMIAAHVGFLVLVPVALRAGGMSVRVLFTHWYLLLFTLDLLYAQDRLVVTVVCMSVAATVTGFLYLRPVVAAVSVGGWVGTGAAVRLVQDGDPRIASAVVVSALCSSVAAILLVTLMNRFAAEVDHASVEAVREAARRMEARVAARTAAEHARTLHDTVINTLAAIAAGGGAVRDVDDVRVRCARDIATIGSLTETGSDIDRGLDGIEAGLRVIVTWSGLAAWDRHDVEARLGRVRRAALCGIVRELLVNVEKHAGTEDVDITVHATDQFVVTVTDRGRGFDPTRRPGHGLTESVHRRAAEAGFTLTLMSIPGVGTSVSVTGPVRPVTHEVARSSGTGITHDALRIRRTTTWGWCVVVTGASLVSAAIGTGTLAMFGSIATIAAVCLMAWWLGRDGRSLPAPAAALVVAAVPVAFLLGFQGVTADGGDPAFWQGIGLTPLFVVLLNVTRSRWFPGLAAVALVLAAVLVLSTTPDPELGWIAMANALLQLSQVVAWLIFNAVLTDIAARATVVEERALHDRAHRAMVTTSAAVRERWRDAQLGPALQLLRDIADGHSAPGDPVVQQRAGREEHLLRQLLQLSPDLIHLGPWLARAIGRSRLEELTLSVRVGDQDVPDEPSARHLGTALQLLLDTSRRGSHLVVAAFGTAITRPMTLVGPSGFLGTVVGDDGWATVAGCRVHLTSLRGQDLVEINPN